MPVAFTSTAATTLLSLPPAKASEVEADITVPPTPSSTPCRLKQNPISVTLDGPSIFTLAAILVVSIHYFGPHITSAWILISPFLLVIHNDYQNFLHLGPGGTPSSFYGYLYISWWRLWALHDPFKAPRCSPTSPQRGILRQQNLPYRPGPRPRVAGIAPQRQLDQHGSRTSYQALRRAMVRLGVSSPLRFGTERSCVEKHGLALFAKHALRTNCQGEIVHVHDLDHSMHMCLHPDDIKEVLGRGWGQRHPLARKGWLLQMPVSPNFVMIYAPRNEHELQVVYRIIEAAIWYTLEEDASLS